MSDTYICQICGKETKKKGMGSHITKHHKLSVKQYYDTYLRKDGEGYCAKCGVELPFHKLGSPYTTYCCKCASLVGLDAMFNKYNGSPAKNEKVQAKMKQTCLDRYGAENVFASEYGKQKIKETCMAKYGVEYSGQIESRKAKIDFKQNRHKAYENILKSLYEYKNSHNLVLVQDLLDNYGAGWYYYFKPETLNYKGYALLDKSWENKAKEYAEFKQNNKSRSYCEYEIINFIKTIYTKEIKTNIRTVIKPYELDIYLPDIKVAIEENDKFWHSKDNPFSRIEDYDEYHNTKKKLCEGQNIILIYIYRDEWLTNRSKVEETIKNVINQRR